MDKLNQLAIMRCKYDRLPPGTLVKVSERALAARYQSDIAGVPMFPVAMALRPSVIVCVPRIALLDYRQYLRKQPVNDCCLLAKACWNNPIEMWLENPETVTFGFKPHRFESYGEVIYFMNDNGLLSRKFRIMRSVRDRFAATVLPARRRVMRILMGRK